MRAIDADALIARYGNWYTEEGTETGYIGTVKGIVDGMPTIEPEPHWIPVREMLPEANGRYLITRGLNACDSPWNRTYIAYYSDLMGLKRERIWWQGNVGKSDFERLDDVLAWMPLPEPYKGDNE